MTDINQHIDTFIQANLNRYIDEISRLCAQPSVSAKREGLDEMAELVAQALRERGADVRLHPTAGAKMVVGHLKGASERTMLLYNHYDVQPPEPLDLWVTPPFQPTVRDGALYARGATDDKGQFVGRLAAVDALLDAYGGTPPCNITFLVEGEEEIGSPHIAQFVNEHLDLLRCDASIWEEGGLNYGGNPRLLLGARGVLGCELRVTTLSRDAHSGSADVLPNAAWRLLRALACLKDENERILIEGFYDAAKLPSSADLELLDSLPDDEEQLREQFGVREFVRGVHGAEFLRAIFEPTCNIQGITTGYQGRGMKTVIPAQASAKLDFRLVPDQNPDDIFAKLRAHLDNNGFADVELERYGSMFPYKTDPTHPLVTLTAEIGEQIYGKATQRVPMAGGSSPMYAIGLPFNVPIVWAGVGYWDNRAHAPNEHVRLEDFVNGSRHLARVIDGFARL